MIKSKCLSQNGYHVESSQHEHGVDEHEEPAADHFETVKENRLRADVTKTEN